MKGLEIVKKCAAVYLENYTSTLQCRVEALEKFYKKKIILADREFTEKDVEKIVEEAKTKDVAFLIVGDPFSATTHIELFKTAKKKNIAVTVIHNASILTAVGITGLQLYKFGKVTSLPFDNPHVETPYLVLKDNLSLGLHTLFLLDLRPEQQKFMTIREAIEILERIEEKRKENIFRKNLHAVGCARVGSDNSVVRYGTMEELKKFDFGKPPYCLIIPGKLHFAEEEMLEMWS